MTDNTEQLNVFLNQFYDTSKSDYEVLKVQNEALDSFYMEIDSKTDEGIVEFSTTSYVNENGNLTSVTEFSNEIGYSATYEMTFEKLENGDYKILDFSLISSNGRNSQNSNRGWFSDYGDCIGGVLDTGGTPGRVITVLGIAGGAGCVPCGNAGGVIFGFAALGCTAV